MPFKNNISERLKEAGIENHIFEAKIIERYAKKDDIENITERRCSREPLQYILGEWEFYGDVYKLNKDCLIPRPESEFLTEYIIKNAPFGGTVADLCSGSGCVSVSALKRREDLSAVLIDISGGALEISKENAALNGVAGRAEFYCLDITADFLKIREIIKPADIIAVNPPYLTRFEIERIKAEKTELSHEPQTAFFGGEDGLDFYRAIINNYSRVLKDGAATVFECGANQSGSIIKMFENIGFSSDIIRDYAKIERIVIGSKNKK